MMKEQKDFYIGWQDKMPPKNKGFLQRFVVLLFISLPLLAAIVVMLQKPFNNHQFEFGNLKKITGTYYSSPFPILIADEGILPDSISQELLLVGYGKFGAKGIMSRIEDTHGLLSGKKISLSGTLIYGDGKSLLELTEEDQAFLEIIESPMRPAPPMSAPREVKMEGEILDPKCYFGVMKPGEGKIHKSCAVRCISGGIPPVMRQDPGEEGAYRYYLMVDQKGQSINKTVLPFIAEQVQLKGTTRRFMDWEILFVDLNEIELLP